MGFDGDFIRLLGAFRRFSEIFWGSLKLLVVSGRYFLCGSLRFIGVFLRLLGVFIRSFETLRGTPKLLGEFLESSSRFTGGFLRLLGLSGRFFEAIGGFSIRFLKVLKGSLEVFTAGF